MEILRSLGLLLFSDFFDMTHRWASIEVGHLRPFKLHFLDFLLKIYLKHGLLKVVAL